MSSVSSEKPSITEPDSVSDPLRWGLSSEAIPHLGPCLSLFWHPSGAAVSDPD